MTWCINRADRKKTKNITKSHIFDFKANIKLINIHFCSKTLISKYIFFLSSHENTKQQVNFKFSKPKNIPSATQRNHWTCSPKKIPLVQINSNIFLWLTSNRFFIHFFWRSRRIALPLLFIIFITVQIFARPHNFPSPYAHPAVLENAAAEELYPSHLRNPFYKTPRVREALSRSSWFGYGEQPVLNRIADSIPRKEVYKLLTHAGFVPRRDYPYV